MPSPAVRNLLLLNGGGAFSLARIPNLALWLAADLSTITLGAGMATAFASASSQYLNATDAASLDPGAGSFAISAWLYLTNKTASQFGVAKWLPTGGKRQYTVNYDNAGDRFQLQVTPNGTTSTTVVATAFGSPTAGTWYHVVAQYDGANIIIQVNNGTQNTTAFSSGIFAGNGDFTISGISGGGTYWNGRVQAVGFWKRTLTAPEITALYNGGIGIPYASLPTVTSGSLLNNLSGYWELNEPSGTRFDLSGNGNNLTPNNSPTAVAGNGLLNAVTQENDLSTAGNNAAQATQANKPVYRINAVGGKQAVWWDGVNDVLTTSNISLGTAHYAAVVYQPTTTPAADRVLLGNASGTPEYALLADATNLNYRPAGSTAVAVAHGGLTALNNYFIEVLRNGLSVSFFVNGVQKGSAQTLGANTALTLAAVGAYTDASSPTYGMVPEVIEVARAITSREQQGIRKYIAQKYGIAISY